MRQWGNCQLPELSRRTYNQLSLKVIGLISIWASRRYSPPLDPIIGPIGQAGYGRRGGGCGDHYGFYALSSHLLSLTGPPARLPLAVIGAAAAGVDAFNPPPRAYLREKCRCQVRVR